MEEKKYEKKKISVDLKEESIEAIEKFRDVDSLGGLYPRKSMAEIINNCVTLLLGRTDSYRREVAKFASEEMRKNEHKDISQCQDENNKDTFQKLYNFLTYDRGLYKGSKDLTRYDFSDGYLIVPDDWIFLNPERASEDEYLFPHIIEVRNGEKYKIPHFFFLSTAEKLTEKDKEQCLNIAFEKCSALNEHKHLMILPLASNKGEVPHREMYLSSIELRFFSFPKYGDKFSNSVYGELWTSRDMIKLMQNYGENK